MDTKTFQKIIWGYYRTYGRDLPWRRTKDPYAIFVSEVMLQQTQVSRVIEKYTEFIAHFPSWHALANASIGDVLKVWQGLGYNRRGLFLHRAAQTVVHMHNGTLPRDPEVLQRLPGIGHATARSIAAFAFNAPVIFIETNIRRVFIHHFFPHSKKVSDTKLVPLVTATLPHKRARDWYSALMDYGSTLPKTTTNPNRRSAHYTKQSKFKGSNRQIRGTVLKAVIGNGPLTAPMLTKHTQTETALLKKVLAQMLREGLIQKKKQYYLLP